MGAGRFDPNAYAAFSASTVGKTTSQVYTAAGLDQSLNPLGVAIRESRDSDDNPNSTPIIVALDVTGSMGILADNIAREGLGVLFTGILDRKPVPDPHIMFMGIGDANYDQAPLQVSQFEADIRIVEQVTKLYLEHGGGGNGSESYDLAWYFAARHTDHDSLNKRSKRGYLFTVGDENAPIGLTKGQIKRFLGDDVEADLSPEDILREAQRMYDVFHVVIKEGFAHYHNVMPSWTRALGERVIVLEDHKALAETIVSAIEVAEGVAADASASRWGAKAAIVGRAVKALPQGQQRWLPGPTA